MLSEFLYHCNIIPLFFQEMKLILTNKQSSIILILISTIATTKPFFSMIMVLLSQLTRRFLAIENKKQFCCLKSNKTELENKITILLEIPGLGALLEDGKVFSLWCLVPMFLAGYPRAGDFCSFCNFCIQKFRIETFKFHNFKRNYL